MRLAVLPSHNLNFIKIVVAHVTGKDLQALLNLTMRLKLAETQGQAQGNGSPLGVEQGWGKNTSH